MEDGKFLNHLVLEIRKVTDDQSEYATLPL